MARPPHGSPGLAIPTSKIQDRPQGIRNLRVFEHRLRTAGTCLPGLRFWSRLIASDPSAHAGTTFTEPGCSGRTLVRVRPGWLGGETLESGAQVAKK